MLTTAIAIIATAAAYRGAIAIANTGPAGSLRAKFARALGGGGPGPVNK